MLARDLPASDEVTLLGATLPNERLRAAPLDGGELGLEALREMLRPERLGMLGLLREMLGREGAVTLAGRLTLRGAWALGAEARLAV